MTISENLKRLGVVLPSAPRPVGSYVPACQAGDLVFVSGVLPFQEGKILQPGKVGRELSIDEGKDNAYKKELSLRIEFCKILPDFIEMLETKQNET